jgi:hypothetical protein
MPDRNPTSDIPVPSRDVTNQNYFRPRRVWLKVHKHVIIFDFFFTLIKSLYALGKFSKNFSLLFLRFSPEFRSSNIFAVTEHYGTTILTTW